MKIRLNKTDHKTSIEIDPTHEPNKIRFCPLIAITENHDTGGKLKIISTFAGYLDSTESSKYADGLHLASYIHKQADVKGLVCTYNELNDLIMLNMCLKKSNTNTNVSTF